MIDTMKRSFLKALSWRFIAALLLAAITYVITDDLRAVTYITIAYHGIQVVLYYAHERFWGMIKWGKTSGLFIQMTGMSGAGKSTLAAEVAKRLRKRGVQVEVLDGDEYRSSLCSDLGFSREDRNTNIRRLGFVSKVLARNNVVSIIAAINPYRDVREELEKAHGNVKTVYVECDIDTLKARDTKGLYHRAMLPDDHPNKVYNFTGISDPFEAPTAPDLRLQTHIKPQEECARNLEKFILDAISR